MFDFLIVFAPVDPDDIPIVLLYMVLFSVFVPPYIMWATDPNNGGSVLYSNRISDNEYYNPRDFMLNNRDLFATIFYRVLASFNYSPWYRLPLVWGIFTLFFYYIPFFNFILYPLDWAKPYVYFTLVKTYKFAHLFGFAIYDVFDNGRLLIFEFKAWIYNITHSESTITVDYELFYANQAALRAKLVGLIPEDPFFLSPELYPFVALASTFSIFLLIRYYYRFIISWHSGLFCRNVLRWPGSHPKNPASLGAILYTLPQERRVQILKRYAFFVVYVDVFRFFLFYGIPWFFTLLHIYVLWGIYIELHP